MKIYNKRVKFVELISKWRSNVKKKYSECEEEGKFMKNIPRMGWPFEEILKEWR